MTNCPVCGGPERNGLPHAPDNCIDYLLGRNAKLERMLERLEYIETALDDEYGDLFFAKACPICGGIYPPDYHKKIDTEKLRKIYNKGHEDNCELAKLIGEGKQWNAT